MENKQFVNSEKEIWIFLSHSNKDFDKVRQIRNYLEEHSCRPLMFYLMCLTNDDEINDLIKREIDCRTRFIICSSENSRNSKWVQSEVAYIKSCQRTYSEIDLSLPMDEIARELDKIIKKSRIYVIADKNENNLIYDIFSHIRKYDIRCIVGDEDCIDSYVGMAVFFASEKSMNDKRKTHQLQQIINNKTKLLILNTDEYAKNHSVDYLKQNFNIVYNEQIQAGACPLTEGIFIKHISEANNIVGESIKHIVQESFSYHDIYTMGKNFLSGITGEKDEEEANRLYKIAYEKAYDLHYEGYPGGTKLLAYCVAKGIGTEKDLKRAIFYYHDFQLMGYSGGLDEMNKVEKELIQQCHKEAENNDVKAIMNLGYCYRDWVYENRDLNEALKWFKKAEALGNEDAKKLIEETEKEIAKASH